MANTRSLMHCLFPHHMPPTDSEHIVCCCRTITHRQDIGNNIYT